MYIVLVLVNIAKILTVFEVPQVYIVQESKYNATWSGLKKGAYYPIDKKFDSYKIRWILKQ